MKKSVYVLFILVILFSLSLAIAANETSSGDEIDKSYACLKSKIGSNCGNSDNVEQISFNLLAMAYDSSVQKDCKTALLGKKNNNCWGQKASSTCTIKSTALAVLALNNINEKTDDAVNWLLSKRISKTGLTWFLEIDTSNSSTCTINGQTIKINENKKISGSDPTGLVKTYNSYWFEIIDLKRNFTISCDTNFVTSLLYKKPGSSVLFVPSNSHSAAAHDSTEEKVESYCLSTGEVCDYEGTLWASIALAKEGEDVSYYMPYLSGMSDETSNIQYLPSAFLYMLTSADDYYSDLISRQKENKYWGQKGNLYDTAIALLALQNVNTQEVENTKKYLLSIRDISACWNDVNNAFILYAGWPRLPVSTTTGQTTPRCEDFGYSCSSVSMCSLENQLENFACSGSYVCCKLTPREENCSEKQGLICDEGYECDGNKVISSDTNECCLGSCQEIETQNECEEAGGFCKSSCTTSEEEKISYSNYCTQLNKCCFTKTTTSSNKWLLILFLIILIILLVLAIIFRNQLKIWLFRMKSGFRSGKGPISTSRPIFPPPSGPGLRPVPQRMPMRQPISSRPPVRTSQRTERDKDFDETMRKLRDMSK